MNMFIQRNQKKHSWLLLHKMKKMLLKNYYNWLYYLNWVKKDKSIIFQSSRHIYDFFLIRFYIEIYLSLMHSPIARILSLFLSLILEERLALLVMQDDGYLVSQYLLHGWWPYIWLWYTQGLSSNSPLSSDLLHVCNSSLALPKPRLREQLISNLPIYDAICGPISCNLHHN